MSRPTYVPMVPAASAVSAAPARTTVGEIALGVALGLWLFTISAVLVSAVIGWLAGWGFARLV